MNQVKTGCFIAACRKEKGWTQSRLAEQLGITDKAVSKWETGKSMPDLSLFAPLCGLLGITLNELLLGERIAEENLRKKADQVLFEVITSWLGGDGRETAPGGPQPDAVLKLERVKKVYAAKNASVIAINEVSFEVQKGSFVGIMGASGSGKSTLLNLIATVDKPTAGKIEVDGQDLDELTESERAAFRREHLGFIFQEYNLLDTLTLYENIALALTIKKAPKQTVKTAVLALADKLGLAGVLHQFPYEVSGGQRQRCACARAIATSPSLILADEPTGALDSGSARQLLETLAMLRREYGATILMVTHDALSASYCDRILFMRDGQIWAELNREQQSKQAFFADILDMTAKVTEGIENVL